MSTSPRPMRSTDEGLENSREFDLERLIEHHQVGIWRYLRALGCDANEAEDLTQETFLAVLRKPFEYYSKAAAASYLRKVAYHRFISAKRKFGKEVIVAELEEVDERWSQWVSHDDTGDALLDALKNCLSQLTDRARWALEMRFRDKLQRGKIAEALSISDHGAKNLMQRAKQKLKSCIEGKMT